MDNVQLQFDSMQHLWQFKEKVQLVNFEMQAAKKLLCCQLPEEAIELALTQFGAERKESINDQQ